MQRSTRMIIEGDCTQSDRPKPELEQTVLVFQGGGALGA
jgi:hypothetical protein